MNDVSSDVEIDPREILMGGDDSEDEDMEEPVHAKIKEVPAASPAVKEKSSKKRARESDVAEVRRSTPTWILTFAADIQVFR